MGIGNIELMILVGFLFGNGVALIAQGTVETLTN